METPYLTRIIRSDESGIEHGLRLAIHRAVGANDDDALVSIGRQVESLITVAKSGRDRALSQACLRLYDELKAASRGATLRPALERKDCALAISSDTRRREVKLASGGMKVAGYGSTFGGKPDAYNDVIAPGAFTKTLAAHRAAGSLPRMFFSHDPTQVAGIWTDMHQDDHGLVVKGKLADTTLGRDLNTLVEMTAIDAFSIGFMIPRGGAEIRADGVRVIKEIDLHEVSLVSLPANPSARMNASPRVDSRTAADGLQSALNRLLVLAEGEDPSSNVLPFTRSKNDEEDDDGEPDIRDLLLGADTYDADDIIASLQAFSDTLRTSRR